MRAALAALILLCGIALAGCGEEHVEGKVGSGFTTRALTPHYWYTYVTYRTCASYYSSYYKRYRYSCTTHTRTITHTYYRWQTEYWVYFREWGGDHPGRVDTLEASGFQQFQLLHAYHSRQTLLKLTILPGSPYDSINDIAEVSG